jgi:hypothetical protein
VTSDKYPEEKTKGRDAALFYRGFTLHPSLVTPHSSPFTCHPSLVTALYSVAGFALTIARTAASGLHNAPIQHRPFPAIGEAGFRNRKK